jgi:hypothetical protein
LEVLGGVNGLAFYPGETITYVDPDTDLEFKPYLFGIANISLRHDISEILNFSVNIERDNILQNSINVVFGAKTDHFNFKFGTFLGITDNFHTPDAGITGDMELVIPGVFLLSISGSSTLGVQFKYTDNYRETAGITFGFWLGNIIPSFSANMRSLSRYVNSSTYVNDTLYRFLFNFDFFIKNSNFSGFVCAGYQMYSRVFEIQLTEYSNELSSSLVGFGFNWQIIRPLCLKVGFEIPINITAVEPMIAKSEQLVSSKMYAGFIYSFNK